MKCPDCEKLRKIVAELKKEVGELKRRLALYENAHTALPEEVPDTPEWRPAHR